MNGNVDRQKKSFNTLQHCIPFIKSSKINAHLDKINCFHRNDYETRTVKTLLLCKLNSRTGCTESLSEKLEHVYTGINNLSANGTSGTVYATIGKVDAISIYNTLNNTSGSISDNWMEHVYQDRKTIIHKSNSSISYHPIHLIANKHYEDTAAITSCAVITLIYGVNAEKAKTTNPEDFISYEEVIRNWIKDKSGISDDIEFNTSFEIYNAINICDVVVINYTKDIKKSLNITNRLSEEGFARKTLSLICLPSNHIKTAIDSNNPTEIVKNFIKNDGLSLRVEGSIRNQVYFDEYKKKLVESVLPDSEARKRKLTDKIVFGQSDFSFQFTDLNREEVNSLFKIIFQEHQLMAKGCWESHTEFLYSPGQQINTDPNAVANNPTPVLDELYKKYSKFSNCINEESYKSLQNLSWYNEFYELLSVHANIDADPVLHGPSYLIFRFVYILYDYIKHYLEEYSSKAENDFEALDETGLSVSKVYRRIIENSSSRFEDAIRGWGNFTDQVLRIDDMVFHGFGNSSSLYNTLPECALDFYHAMILRIVEYIYKHDIFFKTIKRQLTEDFFQKAIDSYCYDFLLLPTVGPAITIDHLFETDVAKKYLENPLKLSNPEKQVYLVGFPVSKVYSPFSFLVRLVHECFHYFGDICRIREKRSVFLCRYASELIISQCFPEFTDVIKEKIRKRILPVIKNPFIDENEPNGDRSLGLLKIGVDTVLSKEYLFKLRTITKHSPTLYDGFSGELNLNEDLLEHSMYYFREGYADLMMILLLRLDPDQYYSLFIQKEEEERAKERPELLIIAAQRISLVSLVLCNRKKNWREKEKKLYSGTGIEKWTKKNIQVQIEKHFKYPIYKPCNKTDVYYLCEYMIDYYEALEKGSNRIVFDDRLPQIVREQTCPIPCMLQVLAYLDEVINAFVEYYETDKPISKTEPQKWLYKWLENVPSLQDIRNDFEEFFVKDNLFNEHFFNLIVDDHKKVKDLKDKL